MTFQQSYPVTDVLTPTGTRRRPGRPIQPAVRFLVAHDTGNPGATAAAHGRFYRNDPNPKVVSSAHLFVDDVNIIQCIPAFAHAEEALHVLYDRPLDNQLYGVDANRGAIGVEYCYGGRINADEAYARYVWLLAWLCAFHGLDPTRDIIGHQVLDPGRKFDPGMGLSASHRSYDQLLRDVVVEFAACGGDPKAAARPRLEAGPMIATVRLNLRNQPTRTGAVLRTAAAGSQLICEAVVQGEAVNGNEDWCRLADQSYAWSGGLRAP